MKKIALLTFAILGILRLSLAQQTEWFTYQYVAGCSGFLERNDKIWLTNSDGLVSVDKFTGTIEFNNSDNSTLPDCKLGTFGFDAENEELTWISSDVGLIQYDGSDVKVFNKQNSPLLSDTVYLLGIDHDNIKWLKTNYGLVKFDGINWTAYTNENTGFPLNLVKTIAFDVDGSIWMIGFNMGLVHFDGTQWTEFTETNSGIPTTDLNDIDVDHNGSVWIGTTYSGLVKFDGTNWYVYDQTNIQNMRNNIAQICADRKGNIWISSPGWEMGYFGLFDGSVYEEIDLFHGKMSTVYNLYVDTEDNIWMSNYYGVWKYDGAEMSGIDVSRFRIPEATIFSIAIDRDGTKWLGTYQHGLSSFDGNQCNAYLSSELQSYYYPKWCITIGADGAKWIGMSDGLICIKDDNFVEYTSLNSSLPEGDIFCIAVDYNNKVWLGTYDNGLVSFDGTNWEVYNTDNLAIHSNTIYAAGIDLDGNLWIGTKSGEIARFDGSDWLVYDSTNSILSNKAVTSVAFEKNGTKWFGTYGGLVSLAGGVWTKYDTSNSELADNSIWKLAIDRQGKKWLGTVNQGLISFDGTNFTTYNTSNSGIPYNDILALAIDNQGTKWIGTMNESGSTYEGGLTAFNENGIPDSMNEFTPGLSKMKIYPNPCGDFLHIESVMNEKFMNIQVINLHGCEVYSQKLLQSKGTLDIRNLAPGIYLVTIQTDQGWLAKKFLKQ